MKVVMTVSACRHIFSRPVMTGFLAAFARSGRPILFLGVIFGMTAVAGVSFAQEVRHDDRSLSLLFGDGTTPDGLEVYRRSRQMPAKERYEYLLNCVLPDHSDRIRLAVDYLPTNPSPPVLKKYGSVDLPFLKTASERRIPSGGALISPAISLVELAGQLGKLEELKTHAEKRSPTGAEQIKARLALLVLIAAAERETEQYGILVNEFLKLVRESPVTNVERAPEMVVVWQGMQSAEMRPEIFDLLTYLLQQMRSDKSRARERIKRHVFSLNHLLDERVAQRPSATPTWTAERPVKHWHVVSRDRAWTRGNGFPNAAWTTSLARARHLSSHGADYLYYSIPLRGDYQIEGEFSTFAYREIRLAVGDFWAGPVHDLQAISWGTFRGERPHIPLDDPLSEMDERMHVRVAVRDGVRTTYINGRNVFTNPLGPNGDPWIAAVSPWFTSGEMRNVRITGDPEIPDEIDLIANSNLPGWLSYYDETVGLDGSIWHLGRPLDSTGLTNSPRDSSAAILVGQKNNSLQGQFDESLLRYHRPMIEDGTIEYEFFYKEDELGVFPALDRCCFLFDRERVGIHWLTDGKFDRTGVDPANFFPSQAAPSIPLIENDWNKLRLTLKDDTVEIALNGTSILTRKLEPENLRTFGLFHYSGRTEARVRNLRWRGEWPKKLPAPREQELADYSLEDKLASGPELQTVFKHDFSEGLPANKVWGGGREGWHFHKKERPSGVRIDKRGGWYSHHTLSFPIRVAGDFDITLEYEDLQSTVVPGGEGDVQLELIFEDEVHTDFRLYRKHHHRKNGNHEQIVEVGLFQQLEKNEHRDWPAHYTEESNAGTMRVVRRGNQLFLLHAAKGSPHFRQLYRQEVTTAPIRFGGVKAIVETHRDSEVSVIWKQVTVRAEHPTNFAERDAVTVEQLDKQRAKLSKSERFLFNAETPANEFRSWGNAEHILKQNDGWQVKQPGTKEWIWCGFNCMWGVKGDYDLTLELEVKKLEVPEGDHETYFLLKSLRSISSFQDVELKINSTRHGKRELILQQNTYRQNDSWRYEKIKIQPVESVTHLRFARRGDDLYFLYRAEGDMKDRILGHLPAETDDVPPGSFLTMCRTGGEGKETIIKVKSMDVRAEGFLNLTR